MPPARRTRRRRSGAANIPARPAVAAEEQAAIRWRLSAARSIGQKPPVRYAALRHDRHDLPQKEERSNSPPARRSRRPRRRSLCRSAAESLWASRSRRPAARRPSGYTMQIGGLDTVPVDSTQDFMAAYNAVRPSADRLQPRPAPCRCSPRATAGRCRGRTLTTPLLSGMPRRRRIAGPATAAAPASAMMWISWSIP